MDEYAKRLAKMSPGQVKEEALVMILEAAALALVILAGSRSEVKGWVEKATIVKTRLLELASE